jgi:hypothetical protein
VPEPSAGGDEPLPPERRDPKLPCGCVDAEVVRLRPRGAPNLSIEDPCLRKVVDADLAGDEPELPLCTDPACDHHHLKSADGFRIALGWQAEYRLLTLRLQKEAIRRTRAGNLFLLPPAAAATPTRNPRRASRSTADPVVGVRDMLEALRDDDGAPSTEEMNAALNAGEVPGAYRDGKRRGRPWVAMRAALSAWNRRRLESR